MKQPFFERVSDNARVAETFASTVAPSDRLPPPTRTWRPPRDVVIGMCLCFVMGLITFAVVLPARQKRMRTACLSNLREIILAAKQYVRDYDEKFPLVFDDRDQSRHFDSVQDSGWTSTLDPYVKDRSVYQYPAEPNPSDWRDGLQLGYCDYFYNSRFAGLCESILPYVSETIVYGDHKPGNAANYVSPYKTLDPGAARRHMGGANYAFADGHVKWVKPSLISGDLARPGRYSLRY